jgi:hypothetical protein
MEIIYHTFNIKYSVFCPQNVFIGFQIIFILTLITSLSSINRFFFPVEKLRVFMSWNYFFKWGIGNLIAYYPVWRRVRMPPQ